MGTFLEGPMKWCISNRNVKVMTFCKINLYWLSFRFFPIFYFDLLSTLAIVIELVFIACLYLLKSFS